MAAKAKIVVESAPKPEMTLFEKLRSEVKVPEPLRVTEEIVLTCPTKRQLEASQKPGLSEEDSNRVLIGEQYDALTELFADEPPHRWAEFNKAYLDHFFNVQTEPSS